MEKILGIDLGTNSIGWAIVEKDGNSTKLVDNGVHIFQEGVNRVKGNEEPMVKTRTEARASRRHYFRRRLRKIELLNVLIENSWCPYLSPEELKEWRVSKNSHSMTILSDGFILMTMRIVIHIMTGTGALLRL